MIASRSLSFDLPSVTFLPTTPSQGSQKNSLKIITLPITSQQLAKIDIEREYTLLALELTEGKKKEAADLLGIDRKTLYRKLEEYGGAE